MRPTALKNSYARIVFLPFIALSNLTAGSVINLGGKYKTNIKKSDAQKILVDSRSAGEKHLSTKKQLKQIKIN